MGAKLKGMAWFAIFGQAVVTNMAGHDEAGDGKRQSASVRDAVISR